MSEASARSPLDSVILHAKCPICGARISAPYVQVRTIGIFACGCGTRVDAVMSAISAEAVMGLVDERTGA